MKFYIATVFLLHGLSPVAGLAFGFFGAGTWLLVRLSTKSGWLTRVRFRKDDSLFATIYLLGLLPLVLDPLAIGKQNIVYLLLWPAIWFVCFWWIREWSIASKLRFIDVSKAAAAGCIALSGAIILEFILANSSGRYLSDFIPFSISTFPDANVLGDELKRPRGFSAEAGFTAIAFECLLPLSFYAVRNSRLRLLTFAAWVIPAYLLLFSAASISFFALTSLVYIHVNYGAKRALVAALCIGIPVALIAITSDDVSFVLYEIIARKFLEFSTSDGGLEAETFSRPEAYSLGLAILTERPFGIGWGSLSQQAASSLPLFGTELKGTGLISLPLEVGAAAGWLGLLLYLVVVFRKLKRLSAVRSLPSRLVFFSLLWVSLHHVVVLEFWFPMLWLSMALADTLSREHELRSPRARPSNASPLAGVGSGADSPARA